ncbi:hypothetical protein [Christiangramia flava]|uniref:Uncharacterized protein n=1 Tax=Christiangramia flava JLT2011 TaxID=1229726 RepID=A0A1L7IA29_9FLAO|nr:hypothetical protein [Christiangramia flava]APU69955.1 hypothetical protein GRFL_3231 [Christiangramia flava JLT2011]OSS39440.1 hypothetical protein C723_1342 [Christiangramia flava JLT2011]
MTRWAVAIVIFVLVLAGGIYTLYERKHPDFDSENKTYEIVKKWNIPNALDEISGIVWLGDYQVACIQDEDGILFVYDLDKEEIVKKIQFGEPGDYEGLTYLNDYFYIARSDGKIFRMNADLDADPETVILDTPFTTKNNIEGIAGGFDDLLLIAVKGDNLEGNDDTYKALYTYDPVKQEIYKDLEITVDYNEEIFKRLKTDDRREFLRPADVAFHPETRDIYILDAEKPKLVITDRYGKVKKIHELDPAEFFQPEGICFTPAGIIYIANEGKGGDPNILEVNFN